MTGNFLQKSTFTHHRRCYEGSVGRDIFVCILTVIGDIVLDLDDYLADNMVGINIRLLKSTENLHNLAACIEEHL